MMDTEVVAREIVSIRGRLRGLKDDETAERQALLDRMHMLQELLVEPEPERIERDEVERSYPVPPV